MKLYSSLNSIHIAVPDSLPSFLPHVHVRDDPKITFEEWQYIKVSAQIDFFRLLELQTSILQIYFVWIVYFDRLCSTIYPSREEKCRAYVIRHHHHYIILNLKENPRIIRQLKPCRNSDRE